MGDQEQEGTTQGTEGDEGGDAAGTEGGDAGDAGTGSESGSEVESPAPSE